jgi:hypothetical protein
MLSFIVLIVYGFVLNSIDLPFELPRRIIAIIVVPIALILYALLIQIKNKLISNSSLCGCSW